MHDSKRLLLAAALAVVGASAFNCTPAEARVVVSIYAPTAPPPLRAERMPPPRVGYVWVPGSWSWGHNRRYVWQRGHSIRERRGYHYAPSRWEQDGQRWRYDRGRWDH
jgi:hypothetical protein